MPAPACSHYRTGVAQAENGGLRSLGLVHPPVRPPVPAWVSSATHHSSLGNVILAQSEAHISRDGKAQLFIDGGGDVFIPFPSSFSIAEIRLRNCTKCYLPPNLLPDRISHILQ